MSASQSVQPALCLPSLSRSLSPSLSVSFSSWHLSCESHGPCLAAKWLRGQQCWTDYRGRTERARRKVQERLVWFWILPELRKLKVLISLRHWPETQFVLYVKVFVVLSACLSSLPFLGGPVSAGNTFAATINLPNCWVNDQNSTTLWDIFF